MQHGRTGYVNLIVHQLVVTGRSESTLMIPLPLLTPSISTIRCLAVRKVPSDCDIIRPAEVCNVKVSGLFEQKF